MNTAADGARPLVMPVRKQAEVILRNTHTRLDRVLPLAMREQGIDMWLILCQEDHLDPVFRTMIPLDCWCPILQLLVLYDRGTNGADDAGVERINISGTNTGDLFDRPYTGQIREEQWQLLAQVVAERAPKRIGINTGAVQWAASGLSVALLEQLHAALPAGYAERLESAEPCAVRYLSTLTEPELECMEHAVALSMSLLDQCYSRAAVTPGVTTTDDLVWQYWQRVADLGLTVSFMPAFYLVRSAEATARWGASDRTIRPGDFVRCDLGLHYLRLTTDHQRWMYCLRPGEHQAPEPMRALMAQGNRLQDVYLDELRPGLTGDELLTNMLQRARGEGLPHPKVYSHGLGLLLHEPGPLIGLPWEQDSNPGRGDVVAQPNYAFTMELSVADEVPGWGRFACALEEDVVLGADGARILCDRQTAFRLV